MVSQSAVNSKNGNDAQAPDTLTSTSYAWWDGAQQAVVTYDSDTGSASNPVYTTTYNYNGIGQLLSSSVNDGMAKTLAYTLDGLGQIIRRDDSRNSNPSGPAPHEVFYRFAGKQMGMSGNDGTRSDISYEASINQRIAGQGTSGIFANGTATPAAYADFSQSLDRYTVFRQGSAGGGTYTVRTGDTLQSIAASLWGDGNLWYRLAEANGLSAGTALSEGQSLTLPAGVTKSTHNAGTFRPYDAGEALGDTLPTTPKPPKTPKCGALGQLILIAIAIAVAVVIAGPGAALLAQAGAAMAGSVVSQAVGVATGLQDRFSFKQVALAGVSAAVGVGVGDVVKLGTSAGASAFSRVAGDTLRGALSSGITQGIGVATGLQKQFSWTGVAVAGVGNAVAGGVTRSIATGAANASGAVAGSEGWNTAFATSANRFATRAAATMADTIAQAATRSVLKGNSFGDNLLASLPSALGNLAGRALAGASGVKPLFDGERGYISQPEYPEGKAAASADFAINTTPQTPLGKIDPDQVLGVTRLTGGDGNPSIMVTGSKTAMTPAERAAYKQQIAREEADYLRSSGVKLAASLKQVDAPSEQRGIGVNTETGETFGIGGGTLTYENYAYLLLNTDKNLGQLDGSVKYYTQEGGLDAILDRLETDITTRLKSADSSFNKLTDDVGIFSLSLGEKDYSNDKFNGLVNLRNSIGVALKDKGEEFPYVKLLSDGLNSRIYDINPMFGMASGKAEEVGGVFSDTLTIGGAGPVGKYVISLVGRAVANVSERLAARAAAKGIGTAADLGIPKFLNPRQSLHIPPVTDGRSVLTANADDLLQGLHADAFTILRQPKPGQVVVDFGKPIGEYWSNGVKVGDTSFGSVSYGKKGAHIIPANPKQW